MRTSAMATFLQEQGYTGKPMLYLRCLLGALVCAATAFPATFGTVVPLVGGASDLVLDEARQRLYLVNTSQNRIEIYSIPQRRFLTPVRTENTPLSAAMGRNSKFLYVAAYDGSSLNIIDVDALAVSNRISLPVKPESVAVGGDGRVLISTIGSGANNAQNTLLIYDPTATETNALTPVLIVPPTPANPVLPPPSGKIYLASRSQLLTSGDGRYIVGVNLPNGTTRAVFVYEVASGSVLRSRTLANVSSVLSVSPDGSRFMSGLNLFDSQTLEILAQQNTANSPYPFDSTANFNTQTNQGGSVYSPDGSILYTAFDIAPLQSTRSNISQLMQNDPENLLIRLGIQLPENLSGKMVITSDGGTIFALSESGFVTLPIGSLSQSPLAIPDSQVLLLANDQCGVTAGQRSASVVVRNQGRGRFTVSASVLQTTPTTTAIGGAGGAGGGAPGGGLIILVPGVGTVNGNQAANITASAPSVRANNNGANGPQLDFGYTSAAAARVPGTISPTHTFLVQSSEAVNIPNAVRVFQNFRDSEAKAELISIPVGLSANEALVDMVMDNNRQRIYIANSGLNRVEVFDVRTKTLLNPIKVGQLPRSIALAPDGNILYVANSGGESISVVDLDKMQQIDRVHFPPLPFNLSAALVTPSIIAVGSRGPLIIMNNGTIRRVIGNTAIPRSISATIGSSTLTAPRTMAATPNGEYIAVLAGNGFVYLYDSLADDFVQGRQVFTGAIQGYFGPIAAGPRGQYYLVNGSILNQALTPTGTAGSVTVPGTRPGTTTGSTSKPISAVTPVGNSTFVRFAQPVLASATSLPQATDVPTVELVDVNTGQVTRTATMLEGPISSVAGTARSNIDGRTIAVDAAGTTVYALTTSGISITTLDPPNTADRPVVSNGGTVSLTNYTANFAPGSLISIFGRNLGTLQAASTMPLPTSLGGTCVTLNNNPMPLFLTSTGQINAQIPPELTAARYSMVVRSVDKKASAATVSLNVVKYAPGIFVDPATKEALVYRKDGTRITKDNPAKRDEPLVMYASGLGATKGGKVTAGTASPASPLAVTDPVELFFGDRTYKQAGIIVDWSGLAPGFVGLYQLNIRVPGDHMRGTALPITLTIGGVSSPTTGPAAPVIAVD